MDISKNNPPKPKHKKRYIALHNVYAEEEKKHDVDNELLDPISLDTINLTGRNYITYLRLSLENVPIILKFWDTISAYRTFFENPNINSISNMVHGKRIFIDPETKTELTPGFLPRLRLYYDAVTQLGSEYNPDDNMLTILFDKYINGTLYNRERLILRSFLFLQDNAPFFKSLVTQLTDIRDESMALLETIGNGSWLLRPGSILNTNLCTVVIMSFIMENGDKKHIVLISVAGYGSYQGYNMDRSQLLPNKENIDKIALPKGGKVFPCILDLLDHVLDIYKLKHNRFALSSK